MPRKNLLTKEEVIAKGFGIVRSKGLERLTARELANALGTSTQPIFTLFSSMEEVQVEVMERAKKFLYEFIGDIAEYDMPFKRFGLRIVFFAKEEPRLFDELFTRGYLPGALRDPSADRFMSGLVQGFHLTQEEAVILFEQTMIFTYGLAQLCAQGTTPDYDEDRVSAMLGRAFLSNLNFIKVNGVKLQNRQPQGYPADGGPITNTHE